MTTSNFLENIDEMPPEEQALRRYVVANIGLSPITTNASTAKIFAVGDVELNPAMEVMKDRVTKVRDGDMSSLEETLTAQVITLDAIFTTMAKRAAANMGTHLHATETYLRMALKAQSQCRTTAETLTEIKNPRVATFIGQQNNANQQQVNNGYPINTRSHAREKKINLSNELLEEQHGERLDSRAAGTAGGVDSDLEALGKQHRRANSRRKVAK